MPAEVIAHRGASGTRPENTMVAFRRAVELGSHMIELDVQLTRDGEVVVIHDWTLGRTTTGRGRVHRWALRELQALDAGTWFDTAYAGERVPTLAEVLDAVPIPINVELKARGDDGLEAAVLRIVTEAGALDRVVFSSFDRRSLVRLRERSRHAQLAVLWSGRNLAPALRVVERVGARALHLRTDSLHGPGARDLRARDLTIRVWTVNDPAESARLDDFCVHGVFTDFPERFLQTEPI
jgi:glycerophosphoryl diester phosphodiesterase